MQYCGKTDVGMKRTVNQDNFSIKEYAPGILLAVVCDGMGGAKSGNIASSLAIDVFVQGVKRGHHGSMDSEAVGQLLERAVKLANFTVYDQSQQIPEFSGMGTTLVAVLLLTI